MAEIKKLDTIRLQRGCGQENYTGRSTNRHRYLGKHTVLSSHTYELKKVPKNL